MWLTTLPSVATPQLKNAPLRSTGAWNASWPKGDYGVGSAATVVAVSPFGLFSRSAIADCVQKPTVPQNDFARENMVLMLGPTLII